MAYNANGTSQYLSTASSPVAAMSPMTIAAWIRRSANSASVSIGAVQELAGSHRNALILSSTNAIAAQAVGATASPSVATTATVTQGMWNHAAAVFRSSSDRSAYLNGGNRADSVVAAGTQTAPTAVSVAARFSTTWGAFYPGDIADFGIWNVALTDAEIASLAAAVSCDQIRPQSLVFYARLIRTIADMKGGLAITDNGAGSIVPHCRLFMRGDNSMGNHMRHVITEPFMVEDGSDFILTEDGDYLLSEA